ncbi:MAG: (d)CMP kinase [Armatimonadota bacterium]|nr:(d)CMP kinase [Armatimonadota bacterium]MDW8104952.1 (d)CMP kinase [Armatimonadota bacterium]MDW8289831.1 (d)CMP kinase [Armatimonadota bacterium]
MKPLVVTIDGPAGAGKSSVAQRVSQALGLRYLDTGALYRALAWKAIQRGLRPQDTRYIIEMARATRVELLPQDGEQRVLVDGQDVTEAIRAPEVANLASPISAIPEVRAILLDWQREFGRQGGVVAEGRDTGTVVFPDAPVKIFLTASLDERARRRHKELLERGIDVPFEQVKLDMEARDQRDATRHIAPLRPAPDAVVIDTTHMSLEQVVEEVLAICRARFTSEVPPST